MVDWLWIFVGTMLGLVLGSFGNSVVYRLPRQLELEWLEAAKAASDAVDRPLAELPPASTPLLGSTRSRCPSCHRVIAWYDNLPLISWLFLKGACRHCSATISFRYPLLELTGAVLGALSAWVYGPSLEAVAVGVAGLLIVWLVTIDISHQLLPDSLLMPLAGIGGYAGSLGWFVSAQDALLGALVGYTVLAAPAWLYKALRGHDGLGGGDALLLAALGLYIGPLAVMYALIIAGVLGILNSLVLKVGRFKDSSHNAFAFGPWLAVGALVMFVTPIVAMFRV